MDGLWFRGSGAFGEGVDEAGAVAIGIELEEGLDGADGVVDRGAIAAEEFADLLAGGDVVGGDVDEDESGVGNELDAGAAEEAGGGGTGGAADLAEEAQELLADG